MKKMNNILVPIDFSQCSQGALANALMLAARFNAKLTLLHIVTVHDNDPYNPIFDFPQLQDYYAHCEEQVKTKWDHLELHGIKTETIVQRGFSPYTGILEFLSENDMDLVAMGTHGHKGLAHFLLGSVTEKTIHHANCPVLTVRPDCTTGSSANPYKKLLVPIDFSGHSGQALKLAIDLVEQDGKLDILHVMENEIHPAYYSSDVVSLFDFMPHLKTHTTNSLKKMTKKIVPDELDVEYHIAEGIVYKNIIEIAKELGSDAIVMGTHGINNLEHLFIGSVANRVIRKAPCPVVTVK